ncbi:hypothetical protein [Candidatus Tokpelaia sp.]|uniref:hypothetical protein n=1 Tax=Candidatus Tokpelaia sp. TaxID=2233777 RepID=UPI001239B74C|nr:hypothetical protein [Candidatus Tokpelaia sp.]
MKKSLVMWALACGVTLGASASAQAAVHNLDCTINDELRQTTDYKKKVRPYKVNYTITTRGWATPPIVGWYNRGIFIQRYDSITGTTVTYSIPNNSSHFIKSGKSFAWSKDYKRGYVVENGDRQFTFTYSANGIEVSDADALLKKTFIGTCVKVPANGQAQ